MSAASQNQQFPPPYPAAPGHVAPPGMRSGPACPQCSSQWQAPAPRPWYLQAIGAAFISPVMCCQCGHVFDAKKPHADFRRRARNIGLAMNLIGAAGIVLVVFYVVWMVGRTLR